MMINTTHIDYPFLMTLGDSCILCACHLRSCKLPLHSLFSSLHPFFGSCFPFLCNITILELRIKYELSLKRSNPSFCSSLIHEELDVLLFMQFCHLHLLFSGHGIPDCLGLLLTLYLPHKGCHFGFC